MFYTMLAANIVLVSEVVQTSIIEGFI